MTPVSTPQGPYDIVAADFNGDGKRDLAISNTYYGSGCVNVLLGNGDGTFASTANVISPIGFSNSCFSVATADVNNDGKLDVLAADFDVRSTWVLLGAGNGTFTVKGRVTVPNSASTLPVSVAVGDLNGDGIVDIANANNSGTGFSIATGAGDGTFTAIPISGQVVYYGVAIADFNGDGVVDTALLGSNTTIYTSAVTKTFIGSRSSVSPVGVGPHQIQAVYSGDATYSPASSNTVSLTAQPATTSIVLAANPPSGSTYGQQVALSAALTPYTTQGHSTDGETVAFYNGTTSLGTAILASGVATLNVTSLPAGANALKAVYGGDTNFLTSTSNPLPFSVAIPTTITLAVTSASSLVTTVASPTVVTLTATVAAGTAPVTTGQVNFCDATATYCTDIHILGTAQLTSAGTAVIRLLPAIGTHSYKAVFVGVNVNAPSSSRASTLTVTGSYATNTTVSATGVAGNYTLDATVVGVGSRALTPTSNVSFFDTTSANLLLATAPLAMGTPGLSFVGAPNPSATGVLVETADVNGDGKPDLISDDYSGGVTVSLGNGDGTFTALPTMHLTPSVIENIGFGDFNGDGKLDLVVVNSTSNLIILLGNGDGTFTIGSNPAVGLSPTSVAVGDWDQDGKLDLAVTNDESSNVTILLGKGDGTFTPSTLATNFNAIQVVAGDFNGDGKPDLAVVTISALINYINIFLGNGNGTFTPVTGGPVVSLNSIYSIAVADFNEDGKADLVVPNGAAGNFSIYLGHGDGTFTSPIASPFAGYDPSTIQTGDFNGDGKPDFVVPIGSSANGSILQVFLGNGDGTVSVAPPLPYNVLYGTAVADFNGDGNSDIAFVNGYSTTGTAPINVLLAQAGLTVTASTTGVSPIGTGTHQVKASYPGDSNFTPSASSSIGITAQPVKTTLVLTANPASSTYGQQVTLTATLSPSSVPNLSTTDGETISFSIGSSVIGTGTLSSGVATFSTSSLPAKTNTISASYAGDTNLGSSTSSSLSYAVAKAMPTISWTPPSGSTYTGQPIGPSLLNATSTTSGSFSYRATNSHSVATTLTAASVLPADTYTLTVSFSPTDSTDNATATASAIYTVAPAPLTVVPANASRVFGISNPAFTATVAGALNSDTFTVTGTTTATTSSPVGSYPITYSVAGTNLANYVVSAPTGTLTVTTATPTITWATPASITYGSALTAAQLNATASTSGAFTYTPTLGTVLAAGRQTLSVTFTPTDATDYVPAQATTTITISQAPLSVTAANVSRSYGAANPTFPVAILGAVNGDTFTSSASSTAVATSPVGAYAIVPSVSGSNLANYTVTVTNGTLAVSPATLTLVAANAARTYAAANPSFQVAITGVVNGDIFTSSANTTAIAASPVGAYAIVPSVSGSNLANYVVSTTNGTLTVGPAVLAVVPANATRTYGAANPALSGNVTGVLNGDTFTVTGATTATSTSPVGSYSITYTVAGTNLANYSVIAATGTLTITQATPAITWPVPAAITYGAALSATQLNASSSIPGSFSYTPAIGSISAAGTITLIATFTPSDITDYTAPPPATVQLTVNKAPLTITAGNTARTYGAVNPALTGTITGALNGDTFTQTFSTITTAASIVGSYPIVPSVAGANLADYAIISTNGALTISQAGTATTFGLSNSNLTLTATVASLTSGTPTGSVGFYEGQTLVGTGTLVNGVATYTAGSFPSGNVVVSAQYSGDVNFTQSASPPILVLALTPAQTALTVSRAGTVTDSITMAAATGFSGMVQFSCSGLPADASCSFQPASFTFSGIATSASVTMTIQTGVNAKGIVPQLFPSNGRYAPAAVALLCLPGLLASLVGRRKRNNSPLRIYWVVMLACIGLALTGCGGGSPSSSSTPTTPSGTSTIQVVANASSGVSPTTSISLTVQ